MHYITGFNRKQAVLIPETIDLLIDKNNPVRFIDVFVDSLDVASYGFRNIKNIKTGRPPSDCLKSLS